MSDIVLPTAEPDANAFPTGFLWGASTSAYQIEGSPLADGAGENIWHRFARTPGCTKNGETGDVACDHYRRWREDVDLMARLGLDAYRFSIAWARVFPEGTGRVNDAGLAFYDRLVDALLAKGIAPNATLYHWDLPATLDERGGWTNPDAPRWFADYADAVFRRLGDRVPMWATLNEPWVIVNAGYLHGVHAPGRRSAYDAVRASHQLLLAHAAAVERYRALALPGRIGVVVNLEPKEPASDRAEDVAATERADAQMNRQYLDPLFLGRPAEGLAAIFGEAWVDYPDADYARIAAPVDWLGINYYKRGVTAHDATQWPVYERSVRVPGSVYTAMDWESHAPSLTRTLAWVRERYGAVPQYVTENGSAFADPAHAEGGVVDDPDRLRYLKEHIAAVGAARAEGVDVRGYFTWSLLDNFEWGEGYGPRMGIVHVDYASQERTVKTSGAWYRDWIARSRAGGAKPAR
jgi:beta-glucosidase